MRRKVLLKAATRRLLKQQLVVVAILGSGKKSDAMWHVPQPVRYLGRYYVGDSC